MFCFKKIVNLSGIEMLNAVIKDYVTLQTNHVESLPHPLLATHLCMYRVLPGINSVT